MTMKDWRIAVATLGCKVNQVETAALLEEFGRRGLKSVSFKERADLYLINTCAVTAKAAYESRQLIRRALKRNPRLVVVTGCYVQIGHEEILAGVNGPVYLIGNDRKSEIPDLVANLSSPLEKSEVLVGNVLAQRQCSPFLIDHFFDHSRAFARIQDGCSAFCKYCVVPYARGPARSLPEDLVLEQIRRFKEAGYQEIVLTGIHLGLWGRDLDPPKTLLELLQKIEGLNPPRLRLSSLEPLELHEELLLWARSSPIFCPHFHLPLQSGDDEILKKMGRPYQAGDFEDLVWEIKHLFPEAAIGVDVLVGFPGEDEKAFEHTYKLLKRLPVTYLHVFPYSPRPLTEAAKWPQVPSHIITQRVRRLKELSQAKRKAFYLEQVGKILNVLVQKRDRATGLYRGLSENYVPVLFDAPQELEKKIVPVLVERVVHELVLGRLVSDFSLPQYGLRA